MINAIKVETSKNKEEEVIGDNLGMTPKSSEGFHLSPKG